MIIQAEDAEDWVIATEITTKVREFVRMAFLEVGIELKYTGKWTDEKGYVISSSNLDYQLPIGKEVVAFDPRYFRPTEVDLLIDDASKAKKKLGWIPKHDLAFLVKVMMQSDFNLMKKTLT